MIIILEKTGMITGIILERYKHCKQIMLLLRAQSIKAAIDGLYFMLHYV